MRKAKVVIKWGVATISGKGTGLLTFGSRAEAREWYKRSNEATVGSAKRPFKIYVEL